MWEYNHPDELYHYGVLGMKWGVRKNPSKAYTKAVRKRERLKDKSVKKLSKGARLTESADGLVGTLTSNLPGFKQINNFNRMRGARLTREGAKLAEKGRKWEKAMDSTFKHYTIERIPDGNIKAGKNIVYRMMYGNDSYSVTKRDE